MALSSQVLGINNNVKDNNPDNKNSVFNIKDVLEYLYYIANVILACGVIIAIFQLKNSKKALANNMEQVLISQQSVSIAREDLVIAKQKIENEIKNSEARLQRESAQITVDKCCQFAHTIIPSLDRLTKELLDNSIALYNLKDNYIDNFSDMDRRLVQYFNENKGYLENHKIRWNIVSLANEVEGFSMNFTKGICNCEIAYYPISRPFKDVVEALAPFIIVHRKSINSNSYSNIVELYTLWAKISQKEKLEQKASELEEYQKELQSQLKKYEN